MPTLYACRHEDGSITLQGPRDTADVFCGRHPFIDTHLLARAEARNIRKHIRHYSTIAGFWRRAITQLVAHTTATVDVHTTASADASGDLASLTHLGISASAPADDAEALLRAWIDAAETYGGDEMDRPENRIGRVTLTIEGSE